MVRIEVRRHTYHDSIVLMAASARMLGVAGTEAAMAAMATPLNLDVLRDGGLWAEELAGAGPDDLVLAARGSDPEAAIHAGEAVMASPGAANRDPAVFADPNSLDVTRENIVHFGFGHGAHFCIGAHLARVEMQVALTSLLARFPDLRLAVPDDEVEWKDGSAVWGLVHLPVTF